jgi:2-polyprenyl-3-methyl-5-hydroxy-6-metoxy-1,4-benzoquinol methylase
MRDNMKEKNGRYNKDFYNNSWTRWQDMKKFGPASLHQRRLLLNIIKNITVDSIVDVGCGEGSLLKEISKIKNVPLTGIDFSEVALRKAKENITSATFVMLDIADSTNPYFNSNNKFDLVIAADVIEHIYDDIGAIENLKKLSKNYIMISTLQGKMRDSERGVGHYRSYRKNELEMKLEEAGIDIVKKMEWGFPIFSPIYRNLLNIRSFNRITTGRYNLLKILLAKLVWVLFYFNLSFFGDYLIVLGKIARKSS